MLQAAEARLAFVAGCSFGSNQVVKVTHQGSYGSGSDIDAVSDKAGRLMLSHKLLHGQLSHLGVLRVNLCTSRQL